MPETEPQLERRVAHGLVVLGFLTCVGLLPHPWARWGAALLPFAGAIVVLYLKPLGNRMLATGLTILGLLLLVALWRFGVFFRMLDILVGVILVVAGVLKLRGKW